MELGRNICKRIEKKGFSDIDQFATDALGHCKESVRELIAGIAKQLNEKLREDKAFRKKQGLVLKEKDRERSLFTEVGRIDIARDYYRDRIMYILWILYLIYPPMNG